MSFEAGLSEVNAIRSIMSLSLSMDLYDTNPETTNEPIRDAYRRIMLEAVEYLPAYSLDVDVPLVNGGASNAFGFSCVYDYPSEAIRVVRVYSPLSANEPYRVAGGKIHTQREGCRMVVRVPQGQLPFNLIGYVMHIVAVQLAPYYLVPQQRQNAIERRMREYKGKAAAVLSRDLGEDASRAIDELNVEPIWPGERLDND